MGIKVIQGYTASISIHIDINNNQKHIARGRERGWGLAAKQISATRTPNKRAEEENEISCPSLTPNQPGRLCQANEEELEEKTERR